MAQRTAQYTFADILNVAGRKFPKTLSDDLGPVLCNLTQDYIWDKYDWRASLTTLPPFYLAPSVQDYGAPAVVIPTDYYGLRTANLLATNTTPVSVIPLKIIKDLQPTHIRYLPHAISYVSDLAAFRIFPRCPDNVGSPTYLIGGTYKNRLARVTAADMKTATLPLDDNYFEMFVETMKYIAYVMDGDQRAGQITINNRGEFTTTGQAGVAKALIDWAASCEGLEMGDPEISPSEPLVVSGQWAPGLYGLSFY